MPPDLAQADSHARRRRLRLPASLTVAGVLIVIALIAWVIPEESRFTALIVAAFAGVPAAALVRGRLVDPGVIVGAVLVWFFALAPLLQLASERFSTYHLEDPRDSFVSAAIMTALFGTAFLLGLKAVRPLRVPSSPPVAVRVRRARSVIVAYCIVGAAGWAVYLNRLGGALDFLTQVQNKTQLSAGLGYVFLVANLLQVGVMLAAVLDAARMPVVPRWLTLTGIAVAVSLILLMAMRARALMLVAIVLVAAWIVGARIRRSRIVALGAVGILVLFASGRIRLLGGGSGDILESDKVFSALTTDREQVLESIAADYGHFDRLSLVYEYVPRRVDYQLGSTMASVLFIPVPRAWYPEKPVGSGPLLANAFRPGGWDLDAGWASGVTATFIGELYLNGSWFAVPLGGFLLAVVAVHAHRRWVVRRRSVWDAAHYGAFAVLVLGGGLLGEFYGTIISYAAYALPIAVAGWLSRVR